MGYSFIEFPAPGGIATFTVPFPYLYKENVHVLVDSVEQTGITWDSDSIIRLGTSPTAGSLVLIKRMTPFAALSTDYSAGSVLDEDTLDNAQKELFYIIQEAAEKVNVANNVEATGIPTPTAGEQGLFLTAIDAYGAVAWRNDSSKANLSSPVFVGIPKAPTASTGTNTEQIATTAFVAAQEATKANVYGPTFTGVPKAPTATPGNNTTQLATTAFVAALGVLKADNTHTLNVANPHATTKAHVGLGNCDNTSDAGKPVSTIQATAIGLKADVTTLSAHTGNTSNPHATTKVHVGLENCDNTSDAGKPVSTAQQTALDAKLDVVKLVAPGTAPMYAARTWATWDGTGTVPATPKGGGNVASITDLGVGRYRINFTVNMPDVNYAVLASCNGIAVNAIYENKLVSSVEVLTKNSGSSAAMDVDEISCMIVR